MAVLSRRDLKAETESEIIAAQDQALQIIMKEKITNRNRKYTLCQQLDKTTDHVTACPILAKEQYVKRHDSVLKYALTHAWK